MHKKINNNPNIYTIYVPLPNNPLKSLNCYVIETVNKNIIIDTGFNMPACYDSIITSLNELKIDMDKTELFLTHMHADHTGLASSAIFENTVIYMSATDYEYVKLMLDDYWIKNDESYIKEGFRQEELNILKTVNPAKIYNPEKLFKINAVKHNTKIQLGEYELTCISTPGHTPGHMCLYMENEKILFSGDHILFDISPNISRWPFVENSLKDYLDSLEKIKSLDVKTTLPAHRGTEGNVLMRIDELICHHKDRLDEILHIIRNYPGLNAYDIAGKMSWSMKGKAWGQAPIQQKWFAVGEALAHLDYLEIEQKVQKLYKNNAYVYYEI